MTCLYDALRGTPFRVSHAAFAVHGAVSAVASDLYGAGWAADAFDRVRVAAELDALDRHEDPAEATERLRREHADIIRQFFPTPPTIEAAQ